MYNLTIQGSGDVSSNGNSGGNSSKAAAIRESFGEMYDITDDLSQTNVIAVCDAAAAEIPDSKLLFAVCDLTEEGLSENTLRRLADQGVPVFADAGSTRYFIESGNVTGASGFPDIDLGPFGSDVSRVVIMMKEIDDPILLAAMMFSGMDVRAIAGGIKTDEALYGCALVALREPVTRLPHLEGVIKVRVLQDI